MTFWVAGAAVGAAAVGGAIAADAAGDAADTQAGSAAQADATLRMQYKQTREDQAPWRDRGNAAGNRLAMLMGIDSPQVTGDAGPTGFAESEANFDSNAYLAAHPEVADPVQWANSAYDHYQQYGKGFGFAFTPTQQAVQAGQQQQQQIEAAKADGSYGSLLRGFSAQDLNADPIYNQLAPGIQSSIARSTDDLTKRADFANSFLRSFTENDLQLDPGYDFRMKEGAKGVENSAAARGMQLSGATLKAMTKYSQDFASNEYGKSYDRFSNDRSFAANEHGNAFNRLATDRSFGADQMNSAYNRSTNDKTNVFNRLSGVAGTGQQSNALVASAGANTASQIAQNQIGVGNARAASSIAGANALTNGMNGAFNNYQTNRAVSAYVGRQNGAGGSGAGGGSSGSNWWGGWDAPTESDFTF